MKCKFDILDIANLKSYHCIIESNLDFDMKSFHNIASPVLCNRGCIVANGEPQMLVLVHINGIVPVPEHSRADADYE